LISARSLVRSQEGPPDGSGDVAQLGEHLLCKQGVAGSNPVISTRRARNDPGRVLLAAIFENRIRRFSSVARRCSPSRSIRGQATKSERWMPWRREATKDVASCDKPRGAASRHRSGDVRMGEPGWGNAHSSVAKFIGHGTRTGGTETSQYLEGKESNRDSPSSGERTGSSLNQIRAIGSGVAGRSRGKPGELPNQAIVEGSGKCRHSR
jgi:hypothetical protein